MSQHQNYIPDPPHIIQMDDVQVRDDLTVEALLRRIKNREVKQHREEDIALVKVAQGGPTGGSLT